MNNFLTQENEYNEDTEIIERMASAITGIIRANSRCDPSDLLVESFSQGEINRFWTMAFALAGVQCDGKKLRIAE
ncbi:MAG: hypothetical protein WAO98_00175 [Alphaproteobacteria bacterium]